MGSFLASICLSALAATEIASKDRGPVEVTADRLEVDDQAQTLVFVGNAVATQDDVTIHGKRLTVKYTGEKREIVQVLAEGAVRIQQGGIFDSTATVRPTVQALSGSDRKGGARRSAIA